MIGVCFVSISPLNSWVNSWLHRDCARFGGINPTERFFTLAEAKEKLGREVHYAQTTAYQSTGRVVMWDMVSQDKFFAVVYWDACPDTGKPGVRHYSKDTYENRVSEE